MVVQYSPLVFFITFIILFMTPSLGRVHLKGILLNDSFSVILIKFMVGICALFFSVLNIRPLLLFFKFHQFEFPSLILAINTWHVCVCVSE